MELVEYKYLPPEVLMDEYHPSNTTYFKNLKHLERALVAASQNAGMKYTAIAKLHHRGRTNVAIAEEMQMQPGTISTILRKSKVIDILTLLTHLTQLRDGPNIDHRKRMLWEIAQDNQQLEPKTTIAAIAEMNKIDGIGKDKQDTKVEITLNQTMFPKGPLDQ